MPKFEITVRNKNGEFKEIYDKPTNDIVKWGRETIDFYNRILRPHELKRTFVSARLLGDSEEHDWEKSNLVTRAHAGRLFDTYKCKRCGITGKRYGLASGIQRDSVYRAKKYAICKKSG